MVYKPSPVTCLLLQYCVSRHLWNWLHKTNICWLIYLKARGGAHGRYTDNTTRTANSCRTLKSSRLVPRSRLAFSQNCSSAWEMSPDSAQKSYSFWKWGPLEWNANKIVVKSLAVAPVAPQPQMEVDDRQLFCGVDTETAINNCVRCTSR
jgi:hypothetical protein